MSNPLEDKHSRFKRLAEARTTKVLDMLDLIGNLSNPFFYEFSQEEIEEIFTAITHSLESNRKRFDKKTKKTTRRFTL